MESANKGKSGSVRVESLDATRLAQEGRHGRREDASSQARKVCDTPPLVLGGLDLVALQEAHVKGRKQQGKVRALHALVQFPSDLIPNKERAQKIMLQKAVDFINEFHGGDAVFAARLDRDEKGTHKVDVYFLPRWDFNYKDGRTQKRCGIGQFTKKEAKRRYGKEDRRAQGSALQDSLFEYLRDHLARNIMPPVRKKTTAKDRVEPEIYALNQRRLKSEEDYRLAVATLEQEKKSIQAQQAALSQKQKDIDKQTAIVFSAKKSTGQPIEPALEQLAAEARERRRSQQESR